MRHYLRSIAQAIILAICLLMPLYVVAQDRQSSETIFRFTYGKSASKIPFELSNNVPLLQVQVNGSQTLWFIFATGANATKIDEKQAK